MKGVDMDYIRSTEETGSMADFQHAWDLMKEEQDNQRIYDFMISDENMHSPEVMWCVRYGPNGTIYYYKRCLDGSITELTREYVLKFVEEYKGIFV